jgi:hypothetical protein
MVIHTQMQVIDADAHVVETERKPRQNILYTSAEINRLYSRSRNNCSIAPVQTVCPSRY